MMHPSVIHRILYVLIAILFSDAVLSQSKTDARPPSPSRPKLIIGIVIDQMKYDYLYRYSSKYSEGGIKRLLREGYSFENTNYNYVPTYTAPGHACIYTGTTPSLNGIISNDWFDRTANRSMYCVGDTSVMPVGTTSISGKMSPKNLLTTTITDELMLASNFRSKVIGISLKDRGAILPAGHNPAAAYWHDPHTNNWVTSTYYMKELPQWAREFNLRKTADSLLSKPWTTLLPIGDYTESTADDTPYEGLLKGESKPVFPHDLPSMKGIDQELIRRTPFGDTFTSLFARACMEGEKLGKGNETDFLAISYSSTDYVGHMYGTNAIELEDTYIRLDRDLADLISYVDQSIGKGNYLLFLTSDHGAALNPLFAKDHHLPGGDFNTDSVHSLLENHLRNIYGEGKLITHSDAHNIYLDHVLIDQKKINAKEMRDRCVQFIKRFEGVAEAVSSDELTRENSREGIFQFIQNGYHDKRSADVIIELAPGWIDWHLKTGTTHGSSYEYDTHVPLLFYGWKIPQGKSNRSVSVTDIAPTLSALLRISSPNGTTGKHLTEILK